MRGSRRRWSQAWRKTTAWLRPEERVDGETPAAEVRPRRSLPAVARPRGVSAVTVDFGSSGCRQWGATTAKEDGRIAVPVMVYRQTEWCTLEGITVVDGAGNAALYGSLIRPPHSGLTARWSPSRPTAPTKPPTAP